MSITNIIKTAVTDHQFNAFDGSAIGITGFALLQWLPYISAGLSVIWMGLRVYILIRDEILNKKGKKHADE